MKWLPRLRGTQNTHAPRKKKLQKRNYEETCFRSVRFGQARNEMFFLLSLLLLWPPYAFTTVPGWSTYPGGARGQREMDYII